MFFLIKIFYYYKDNSLNISSSGEDGGAVGKTTNVKESYLNLQYALCLQEMCSDFGINVVMTRSDMNGLYSNSAKNKKKSEMKKREEIIKKANADMVISIHMNSFPLRSSKGAQVFYGKGNKAGQFLAESVTTMLSQNMDNARETAKVGDYYILNCTKKPAILVECGFLSNPEEEKLLQTEEYIHSMCYSIMCGILMYYEA